MKIDKDYIKGLLGRFFDGDTTNEEEKTLYDFFAAMDVPEELEKYRPMFSYFSAGLALESNRRGAETLLSESAIRAERPQIRRWNWSAGLAASVLLLGVALAALLPGRVEKAGGLDAFEGSYIVRNGVVITNAEAVMPEVEAMIEEVIRQQQQVDGEVERILKIQSAGAAPQSADRVL